MRLDEGAELFMDKLGEGSGAKHHKPAPKSVPDPAPADPEHTIAGDTARFALSTARKVLKGGATNPERAIVRSLTSIAANELFDKEAALQNPVLALYTNLNKFHKQDWWDWEPETLWHDYKARTGEDPSEETRNCTMALQSVLNTNSAFEHWHIFEKVGHAFVGNIVDFSRLQPLEPDECALTFKVLSKLRPQEEYDHEVLTYAAVAAHTAGMVWLPESQFPSGCQAQLDEITFDKVLRDEVKRCWEEKIAPKSYPVSVQIGRLKEVQTLLDTAG